MSTIRLPPEFVARENEFGFLKRRLENAMHGAGSTIFIGGESGVGKTRLVEELIAVAEQNGFQVFRGQCFLESLAPYAPISAMLKEAELEHLLALKDFEGCRVHLNEAGKIAGEISAKDVEAQFLLISGRLLSAEGKREEAEAKLKRAVEIYEAIGKSDVYYYKALFELGIVRKDRAMLEKVLAFFEHIGNKVWTEKVRETLG
ncbi:MAG: ATP-binding protein [Thermoplasmata archaeon]